MAEAVIMPKTGMAMEEGLITEWFIKEGDTVSTGDILAEIETDKSSMELESDCSGTVLRILYEEGTTVPVVETIAWIGTADEEIPETESQKVIEALSSIPESQVEDTATPSRSRSLKATPAARRSAGEKNLSLETITATGRHGEIREADVLKRSGVTTPLARRIAEEKGINLDGIRGSGHAGRIYSSDLTNQIKVDQLPGADTDLRVPLTKVQKITGKRMFRSHTEIPAVSMDTKADVTRLLEIRSELNSTLKEKVSINDLVLKAAALALEENPRLNSILDGDSVIYKSSINITMAVATETGLLVPVVRDVNRLSIKQLSVQTAELIRKCRGGTITSEEMEGGSFTVSNIGTFGITSFTPIINQPQAAILGVCAIEDQLKMVNDSVQSRQIMGLSISFDHRISDGAEAAVFFSRVRELLEHPLILLA